MRGWVRYHLKKNDFLILEPGRRHEGYEAAACDYYYIHLKTKGISRVEKERENGFIEEMLEKRKKSLLSYNLDEGDVIDSIACLPKFFHIPDSMDYRALFREAIDTYNRREEHYKRIASADVHRFLLTICHEYLLYQGKIDNSVHVRKSEYQAEQIMSWINSHYSSRISSKTLEEMFEVNFDYINRVFSEMTGQTIFSYLNMLRINQAKELIRTTNLSFTEIAGGKEKGLMRPYCVCNGEAVEISNPVWERKHNWLPSFRFENESLLLEGVIFAPPGERGFFYSLTLSNKKTEQLDIALGLEGSIHGLHHIMNESRCMKVTKEVKSSNWNHSVVFSFVGETDILSLAPIFDKEKETIVEEVSENGSDIAYRFYKMQSLAAGEKISFDGIWGLGYEEVSASTSAKELLRHGIEWEYGQTVRRLEQLCNSRGKGQMLSEEIQKISDTNALFCYYYASGRTIDTEEAVMVTSRSDRYYVSAAFWDRDAMLWAFPCILGLDAEAALLLQKADSIRRAVLEHCVVENDGKKVFAWAVDLKGKSKIYDEPPGSLQLLAYYGFIDREDETYRNTVSMIRSRQYEFSFEGCYIDEIGCAHAAHPWILSLANSLLCGDRQHALMLLERMSMDNGIACESVYENDGTCATGAAFGTCAGFLAYAINYEK